LREDGLLLDLKPAMHLCKNFQKKNSKHSRQIQNIAYKMDHLDPMLPLEQLLS